MDFRHSPSPPTFPFPSSFLGSVAAGHGIVSRYRMKKKHAPRNWTDPAISKRKTPPLQVSLAAAWELVLAVGTPPSITARIQRRLGVFAWAAALQLDPPSPIRAAGRRPGREQTPSARSPETSVAFRRARSLPLSLSAPIPGSSPASKDSSRETATSACPPAAIPLSAPPDKITDVNLSLTLSLSRPIISHYLRGTSPGPQRADSAHL